MKKKKRMVKVMGKISKEIATKWYLDERKYKLILQEAGLFKHIAHHAQEYKSIESLNYTMKHIDSIINNPDYVFYNISKNGIEYYKKLIENVLVVVKPTNKRELFISSVYPVSDLKIANRKNREKTEIFRAKKKYDCRMLEKYSKK